ncbi:hypothetical protein AQ623_00870 [Flavobacterium columnare]|nr:hypothetical protein AQ623_00870 [Flavobacterium columnare]
MVLNLEHITVKSLILTKKKIDKHLAYIEARIQEYLDQLDQNDSQENTVVIKNIQQKIEPLKPKFHIRKKFN